MLGFILNIPYTIIGLLLGIISIPKHVSARKRPHAIIVAVRSFWWEFGYIKRARGMAIGHVILLGPDLVKGDLEHELVHVKQYERAPLIHPILYYIELFRKGYRNNKYEIEAYKQAGNIYRGKEELLSK